jgi:Family of unknown function (DUF5996)
MTLEEREPMTFDASAAPTAKRVFPALPFDEWEGTKETLHRYAQIVGKVRLGCCAPLNHWWNVTLHASSRGLSTGPNPYGGLTFGVDLDFVTHELKVSTSEGGAFSFALEDGLSVADFYKKLFSGLGALGIGLSINANPFDIGGEPLDKDVQHASYDKKYVERYWRLLVEVDQVFKGFSGRFNGKQSPVQLFWHSFDLALTRFSGRRAPEREGADRVTREAYSHEVISFGFWPGDKEVHAPAFYSYTAPEPEGLTQQPLEPEAAFWAPKGGTALLMYDDLRRMDSPQPALLAFLESAYRAGAKTAAWDVDAFRAGLVY